MKIKITYTDQEKQQAHKLARLCMGMLPDKAAQKQSDKHAPFHHIYISDKQQEHKEN